MEKNKKKSKEPFKPEDTPQPPQVMDPSKHPESGDKYTQGNPKEDNNKKQKEKGEKLLGESPSEIDDETTI